MESELFWKMVPLSVAKQINIANSIFETDNNDGWINTTCLTSASKDFWTDFMY